MSRYAPFFRLVCSEHAYGENLTKSEGFCKHYTPPRGSSAQGVMGPTHPHLSLGVLSLPEGSGCSAQKPPRPHFAGTRVAGGPAGPSPATPLLGGFLSCPTNMPPYGHLRASAGPSGPWKRPPNPQGSFLPTRVIPFFPCSVRTRHMHPAAELACSGGCDTPRGRSGSVSWEAVSSWPAAVPDTWQH